MFKKLKAKWNKAPYKIHDYWVAYRKLHSRVYTNRDLNKNYVCILLSIKPKEGDVVDVLFDSETTVMHSYKIMSKYKAPGSDHIWSPICYDLLYVDSRKIDPDNYKIDTQDLYEPQLITFNPDENRR